MKSLGIIPSRFASTRFPGKPLVEIQGKSMIQRVFEQCKKCKSLSDVIVATDDKRIFNHVLDFGGKVQMTSSDHPSGTDRIAEVAKEMPDFDIIVNIQGDEPFIQPEQIETVLSLFSNKNVGIGTGYRPLEKHEDIINPHKVKVLFSDLGKAIYFSRSPVPHVSGKYLKDWSTEHFFKHIGIYAFRRETLLEITKLLPSRLEQLESLEQLRWLENDFDIHVIELPFDSLGIDTPEDLKQLKIDG